jgi:hypothetical protein
MGSIAPFIRIVITRNQSSSFCKESLIKLIMNQIIFGANKLIRLVYEKFKNSFNFPPKKLNLKIILLDK